MQTLQSCQFVELSQNELMNVSGGGLVTNLLSGTAAPGSALGAVDFELSVNDYVIELNASSSLLINGFMGLNVSPTEAEFDLLAKL